MSLSVDLGPALESAVRSLIPELQIAVADAAAAAVQRAMGDRLVGVDEGAELVGMSSGALRKHLAKGHIPTIKRGVTVRLRVSDLLAFAEQRARDFEP